MTKKEVTVIENVKYINATGKLIADCLDRYRSGEIQGGVYCLLNKDGTVETSWSSDIGYVMRIGMMEVAKETMQTIAQNDC